MRSCILLTLTLVIEVIKELADSGSSFFCKDQTATVLIEIIADFMYRLKDRHPYSSPKMNYLDVFCTIMEFLIPNGYLPSAALLKEYSESKVTRELTTLPSRWYFNTKYDDEWQISEESYELLRKRFESRPPFVFYFNPSIKLLEKVGVGLKKGFFGKYDVSVNKWNRLKV